MVGIQRDRSRCDSRPTEQQRNLFLSHAGLDSAKHNIRMLYAPITAAAVHDCNVNHNKHCFPSLRFQLCERRGFNLEGQIHIL